MRYGISIFLLLMFSCMLPVADLPGVWGTCPPPRPWGPNSFNFMQFFGLGNIWQNRMLAPLEGCRRHLGEILDSPLVTFGIWTQLIWKRLWSLTHVLRAKNIPLFFNSRTKYWFFFMAKICFTEKRLALAWMESWKIHIHPQIIWKILLVAF